SGPAVGPAWRVGRGRSRPAPGPARPPPSPRRPGRLRSSRRHRSFPPQLRKNRGGEGGPVGGVGPEGSIPLDQADQATGGEGGGKGGRGSDRQGAAQVGRGAAAGQTGALQRRGTDDDRQGDGP